MTAQTDPAPAAAADTDEKEIRGWIADEVNKALKPLIDKLPGVSSQGSADPPAAPAGGEGASPANLGAMVDAAISKVLSDRDAKTQADDHEAEHERLRAASAEKAPVTRPKRSRWLGNIWDAD